MCSKTWWRAVVETFVGVSRFYLDIGSRGQACSIYSNPLPKDSKRTYTLNFLCELGRCFLKMEVGDLKLLEGVFCK